MLKCTENLKSFRAREQNMFEWRQEPCQFRNVTDKVSLPKVTRNQTKPLRLKRKHTRKNRHASGLNENGSTNCGAVCFSRGRKIVGNCLKAKYCSLALRKEE